MACVDCVKNVKCMCVKGVQCVTCLEPVVSVKCIRIIECSKRLQSMCAVRDVYETCNVCV